MTTPDELQRAVERLEKALKIADQYATGVHFGTGNDGFVSFATILALISERAELLATVERMRGTAAVVLPAMEWADAHIGGRTKYETAQQVVNCLEAYDDALDALRTALTTGEANHKDKP